MAMAPAARRIEPSIEVEPEFGPDDRGVSSAGATG